MTKTQKEYREFEETLLKVFKNKIPKKHFVPKTNINLKEVV